MEKGVIAQQRGKSRHSAAACKMKTHEGVDEGVERKNMTQQRGKK